MNNAGLVCSRLVRQQMQTLARSDCMFKSISKRHFHWGLGDAELDSFCSENNLKNLDDKLSGRNANSAIDKIRTLHSQLKSSGRELNREELQDLKNQLNKYIFQLPNGTHPEAIDLKENKLVEVVNEKPKFNFKPLDLEKLNEKLDCLETGSYVGKLMGPQSYYLKNCLVELEQALISWTVQKLIDKYGFELVSVPDLLNRNIVEACGMDTDGERNQVYKVKKKDGDADICLSGTAEIALAAMFSDETIDISDLPMRLAAVSRCYRAETSNLKKEKGIFRVHEFTKVEMFSIAANETSNESAQMLDEFLSIQTELVRELGLHFNVLDMAPFELGKPAHRKFDIEAWMPGRQLYGEISSTSNCTDHQSRRLRIRYRNRQGDIGYAHTVNGTACAVPRMLISIMETYQQADGSIRVPTPLRKYVSSDYFMPPAKRIYVSRIKS